MAFAKQNQYDAVAKEYLALEGTVQTTLENELFERALGDCSDYKVLDLGGGSGGHARQAVAAGARSVDVVDISKEMLNTGHDIETKAGRTALKFHLADVSKPLSSQLPQLPTASYDLVMVCWTFDHARDIEELEGIWHNVSTYLKPSGRFAGIRTENLRSAVATSGKYGVQYIDHVDIEGGVRYLVKFLDTAPPFEFEGTTMEASYSGSTELAEKYGIVGLEVLDAAETETVKQNEEFWSDYLRTPHFVVINGRKN